VKRIAFLGAAILAASSGMAQADWPERPIRLIVPFNAGGTSDQVARVLQAGVQDTDALSQPISVVNVGGHYSIGARQVMEANPDGYTFLMLHIALMGGEGTGALDFGWRDFKPVAATGEFCLVPVAHKDTGIESVAQLLEKAKAEPDTMIFGVNIGAINHLAGIMLQEESPGSKFRFAQVGGGAENFAAMTGGQTHVGILSGAEVVQFTLLPDGTANPDVMIRPLAYTGSTRFETLSDLPTMKELGYDMEFCVKNWVFAPKDTPQEIVDGFADALKTAQATPRYQEFLQSKGFANIFITGDDLIADMNAIWTAIEPVAKLAAQK
jgi:putative tricarboxylic transport membrane protein